MGRKALGGKKKRSGPLDLYVYIDGLNSLVGDAVVSVVHYHCGVRHMVKKQLREAQTDEERLEIIYENCEYKTGIIHLYNTDMYTVTRQVYEMVYRFIDLISAHNLVPMEIADVFASRGIPRIEGFHSFNHNNDIYLCAPRVLTQYRRIQQLKYYGTVYTEYDFTKTKGRATPGHFHTIYRNGICPFYVNDALLRFADHIKTLAYNLNPYLINYKYMIDHDKLPLWWKSFEAARNQRYFTKLSQYYTSKTFRTIKSNLFLLENGIPL